MKYIYSIFGALFILGASIVLFNTSCSKPVCGNISCKNGSVCKNGFCLCKNGWDGPECTYKMSDKFVGTYTGLYKPGSKAAYQGYLKITQDTSTNDGLWLNYALNLDTITLYATARDIIFFDVKQQYTDSIPSSLIWGEASLDNKRLTYFFQYKVTGFDTTTAVTFFGTKN